MENIANTVTVALKSFNVNLGGDEPVKVEYKSLMIGALNSVPEGGLAPSGMRERIKILDKLENAKDGSIRLTEDEFKTLFSLAKEQKFAVVNKGFVSYLDDMESVSQKINNDK